MKKAIVSLLIAATILGCKKSKPVAPVNTNEIKITYTTTGDDYHLVYFFKAYPAPTYKYGELVCANGVNYNGLTDANLTLPNTLIDSNMIGYYPDMKTIDVNDSVYFYSRSDSNVYKVVKIYLNNVLVAADSSYNTLIVGYKIK